MYKYYQNFTKGREDEDSVPKYWRIQKIFKVEYKDRLGNWQQFKVYEENETQVLNILNSIMKDSCGGRLVGLNIDSL